MTKNIMIVGVGGQGTLLTSRILGKTAMEQGLDVKISEVHGMAQRGGSVVARIRYGENVYSPLILEGTADALLSLEAAEALRSAHFLKKDGFAAVSTQRVIPVTVSTGAAVYPPDVETRLEKVFPDLKLVDCMNMAQSMGDIRLANIIMVGVLSNRLDIPQDIWFTAIERSVKANFADINKKAFDAGRNI